MARPKRNLKEKEEVKIEGPAPVAEEPKETKISDAEAKEIMENESLINSFNTRRAEKTIIEKEIDELNADKKKVEAAYKALCDEYNAKVKSHDYLLEEIKAQVANLENQKAKFRAEHEKDLKDLEAAKKVNEESAKEYAKIKAEQQALNDNLKRSLYEIEEKERVFNNETARLERHVLDVNAAVKLRENDVDKREKKLAEEKAEFEAFRKALEPELLRISAIKNESLNFQKKIEADQEAFTHRLAAFEHERKLEAAKVKDELERVGNIEKELFYKEQKFKEWEENLKDQALELKAKDAELKRQIKRLKLEESINEK